MKRKPFNSIGNDLYFSLRCTCPNPLFIGSEIEYIMKRDIRLTGYNDANFFDNVNKTPRISSCQCGRKFRVQWFRDGVEAEFLGNDEKRDTGDLEAEAEGTAIEMAGDEFNGGGDDE